MPDRISQYRQFRLILNTTTWNEAVGWSFHGTEVKKGVPYAFSIDAGRFPDPLVINSDEAAVTAVVRAALLLDSRWSLL